MYFFLFGSTSTRLQTQLPYYQNELTKSMPRAPPAPTTYHLLTTQLRTTYAQFEFCHINKQGTYSVRKNKYYLNIQILGAN